MAKALKTCPCCGGEAVVDRVGYCYSDTGDHAMDAWRVSCRSCGARTAEYRSEGGAVDAWNRRAERTCRVVSAKECGGVGYAPGCSECGWQMAGSMWHNYCPNCGARLVSSDGA